MPRFMFKKNQNQITTLFFTSVSISPTVLMFFSIIIKKHYNHNNNETRND